MVFSFLSLSFPSSCIQASLWRLFDKAYRNTFKARGFEHANERKVARGERERRNTLYIVLRFGAFKIPRLLSNACQAIEVFRYLPQHDLRRNTIFCFFPQVIFYDSDWNPTVDQQVMEIFGC